MYQVRILKTAVTELSHLDKTIAMRVAKRINWLAENFDNIRPESSTANLAGFYKLRVGDYRVISSPILPLDFFTYFIGLT